MFDLIRKTVTVRGKPATVREWTAGERGKFIGLRSGDPAAALHYLVASCTVEPALTVEQAEGLPAEALDELVGAILPLCGLGKDEGDEKNG
jgi:hypothetical protein